MDWVALAVDVLIDLGAVLNHVAVTGGNHEIAVRIEPQAGGAIVRQRDRFGAAAGRDDEVVLELLLGAVVEAIPPGIYVVVLDLAVAPHAPQPLPRVGAYDVVGHARQRLAREPGV